MTKYYRVLRVIGKIGLLDGGEKHVDEIKIDSLDERQLLELLGGKKRNLHGLLIYQKWKLHVQNYNKGYGHLHMM